jgi:hypothetical protein
MSVSRPVVYQRRDEVLATLTLSCTLFFDANAQVDNLTKVLADAVNLVTPHVTWYRDGTMSRNQHIEGPAFEHSLHEVIQALRAHVDCYLVVDSGQPLDAVGAWSVKFGSSPSSEGENLGFIQVHVDYARMSAVEFRRRVQAWSEDVAFVHGYAGFGVNYDYGDVDQPRNLAMRGFCERYLGVTLTDLVTERNALLRGVKNACWLTLIGQNLLERHGALSQHLRTVDGVVSTPHGLLIVACPEPLLGDRHRDEDLREYIAVNRHIQPFLVDNVYPLPGFPDEEATRAYLHRLRVER